MQARDKTESGLLDHKVTLESDQQHMQDRLISKWYQLLLLFLLSNFHRHPFLHCILDKIITRRWKIPHWALRESWQLEALNPFQKGCNRFISPCRDAISSDAKQGSPYSNGFWICCWPKVPEERYILEGFGQYNWSSRSFIEQLPHKGM